MTRRMLIDRVLQSSARPNDYFEHNRLIERNTPMKKNIPWLVMPLLALGLSACDGGNSTSEVTASKTAHVSHDDHDHAGHGHHHGHGERRELGKAEIGRFTVTAAVLGEINAGADSVIDVEVSGAT